jgi:hypothetical protein
VDRVVTQASHAHQRLLGSIQRIQGGPKPAAANRHRLTEQPPASAPAAPADARVPAAVPVATQAYVPEAVAVVGGEREAGLDADGLRRRRVA